MDKVLILKDTREQRGWSFPEDDTFAGTSIETIKYGDYSLKGYSHLIFIERKASTGELATNITEDRFWRLLENSKDFKYKYIIIEADYEDFLNFPLNSTIPKRRHRYMRVKSNFLISCLMRMSVDYGMNLIFAGTPAQAEKFAHALFKQILKTENNINVIQK